MPDAERIKELERLMQGMSHGNSLGQHQKGIDL